MHGPQNIKFHSVVVNSAASVHKMNTMGMSCHLYMFICEINSAHLNEITVVGLK
jgi:hypothetical protein